MFLNRVRIKNYKSIGACDVQLGPLTFLVGPNGAGKSNFLEALRLVSDALGTSLNRAIRDRGGINELLKRSSKRPDFFEIALQFTLPNGSQGKYSFKVGALPSSGYFVLEEHCSLEGSSFNVRNGKVEQFESEWKNYQAPIAHNDSLFLVNASGFPSFYGLYLALSNMAFYRLEPDRIAELQAPEAGSTLRRDGSNLASLIRSMKESSPEVFSHITSYLSKIVPSISNLDLKVLGPRVTIEFQQRTHDDLKPELFFAASMSDGTLRALGVLVAIFQTGAELVGIEEPESALHPAAAGILRDSLIDASQDKQIIVTSHSPDLLDDLDFPIDSILAVVAEHGETLIGPLNQASKSVLRDKLFTAGELLRQDQLNPEIFRTPA